MQRALIRAAVAAVAVAALAACAASGTRLYRSDVANQYSPETLGRIGGTPHALKLQVHGNPFATSDAALTDAVIAGFQGRTSGIPVNFSAAPANPFPRGDYRTIVVFNVPRGVDEWDLCRATDLDAIETAPANGAVSMDVIAAYCQAELPLSWTSARVEGLSGPADPRFNQLMGLMAQVLFPSRNERRDEDDCVPLIVPCI